MKIRYVIAVLGIIGGVAAFSYAGSASALAVFQNGGYTSTNVTVPSGSSVSGYAAADSGDCDQWGWSAVDGPNKYVEAYASGCDDLDVNYFSNGSSGSWLLEAENAGDYSSGDAYISW